MKKTTIVIMVMLLCSIMAKADDGRNILNINFGWRFHAGDMAGAETTDFDDSSWKTVDVPHDFQISQPWIPPSKDEKSNNSDMASNIRSRLSARGFKKMGIGWYRKEITPDPSWQGKRVMLDFEGIMLVGDVFLNGQRIGGTDYGYVGFDIDITKLLKYGQKNVIAVKADTGKPENSRWYTGGGLFRDVKLVITSGDMYFMRHPLYITTPMVSESKATVNIQAEMACYTKDKTLRINTTVLDADGKCVYESTRQLPFNRKMKTCEYKVDSFAIDRPHLWDCDTPYLYTAVLTLLRPDGTATDRVEKRFGIRSIEFSSQFGMKLNGEKVLLKGIANHHTLGALGAAAYPRAMEKRIQMLKDFGFNHIRTSHNPYSESFLDLCDQYGILVIDELYDKWLTKFAGGRTEWANLWQHDIPEFIKRDRNHPCVIVWSLGNELQTYWDIPYADWGVTVYKLQKTLLQRYDKTRLVTVAMHPRGRNIDTDSIPAPLALETDIAAYNYRYMYFPCDSRRYPWMIFYQSEANTAAMGPNFYEMNLDKVVGLAYWGMIDYLGESNGWPAKGWNHGVFDISLEPKPMAYFLRSMFKPQEPIVHIGIIEKNNDAVWNDVQVGTTDMTENWNRTEGSTVPLYTYTNADEVELLVNGKPIGRKANEKNNPKLRNRIKWDNVAYAAGNIEAVAYINGKAVARHKIETTGAASALKAELDNPRWNANGTDLQHVRIIAVDKKGRKVPTEASELTFSLNGPAEIVGVINGDITSNELTTGTKRRLWQGTATVILRSKRQSGKVTLTTTAKGFKTLTTKLETFGEVNTSEAAKDKMQ